MIKKYRKKPVIIEAIQYNGTWYNINLIVRWSKYFNKEINLKDLDNSYAGLEIPTEEGVMLATVYDYIIKGVKGEFYPCKPDIFKQTYEELKEEK